MRNSAITFPTVSVTISLSFGMLSVLLWAAPLMADASTDQVSQWLDELDASEFEIRETATLGLINAGESALKPISSHFFNASPEAAWRIKRVLQQIGTDSTKEVTSLKAIGILLLLDNQVDSQLSGMIQTWRENRSNRAIQYLTSKGAITAPSGIQRQLFLPQNNIIPENFTPRKKNNNPLRKKRNPDSPTSFDDIQQNIGRLVEGDLKQVQEFVFGKLSKPKSTKANEQLISELFVGQANMGGIGTRSNKATFLEIGSDWNGTNEDLKRLDEIHSLNAIRFRDMTLAPGTADLVSNLSGLQHIGFCNVKMAGGHIFEFNLPANIQSIELKQQDVGSEIIDWLAERDIFSLTIEDCEFPPASQRRIDELDQLELLSLKRMKLDGDLFRKLQKMVAVQRIFLSICKFDPADYRDFAAVRPRVVFFDPVSFLGVQGKPNPRRPGSFSCQIDMVVAGSGADEAGVQAGDIIEAVNDQEIKSFDELRMFISQMDVGEAMQLRVKRGGQTLSLTAKLGSNNRQ